jgi:hypothetical protein
MYEATAKAAAALAAWPLWQAVFLVAVVGIGMYFRFLGIRDRKAGFGGPDMPMYLIAHDVARDVSEIKRLLEDIRNQNELRPPPAKTR